MWDTIKNFVVVPEGLEADANGRGTAAPSGPFRLALERAAAEAGCGDIIWLAPANDFGGPVTEQECAARFLAGKTRAKVAWFKAESPAYIDTRGNALLLKEHLQREGLWPLRETVLVAYGIHLRRAALIFRREGFVFERAIAASGSFDRSKPIVGRLWYMRHPPLHALYELLASAAVLLRRL